MPLVDAKCTHCGAALKVDSTTEAAICEHCGAAYIVEKAINNYNINLHSDVVNINAESEADQLSKAINALIRMKDFKNAYAKINYFSNNYPHDYRCWEAFIRIETNDYEISPYTKGIKLKKIEEYYNKAITVISQNEKASFESRYNYYITQLRRLQQEFDSKHKPNLQRVQSDFAEARQQREEYLKRVNHEGPLPLSLVALNWFIALVIFAVCCTTSVMGFIFGIAYFLIAGFAGSKYIPKFFNQKETFSMDEFNNLANRYNAISQYYHDNAPIATEN